MAEEMTVRFAEKVGHMRFEKIYVLQQLPYDFRVLKDWGQQVIFITTGYEDPTELPEKIAHALTGYDPETDAILPLGKTYCTMLVTRELCKKFPGRRIKYGAFVKGAHERFAGDYVWYTLIL